MKRLLALATALTSGTLFGFGLALARMTDPQKVKDFLDVAAIPSGGWDPSLAFVMGGGLLVAAVGLRLDRVLHKPLAALAFARPQARRIDGRLVAGAALFGVGWGLAGLCPGPAIADLGLLGSVLPFVIAMLVGSWGAGWVMDYRAATRSSRQCAGRMSTSGPTTADIAVVGAGPAGLAAALHFAHLGYDVALVAPASRPADERTSALLGGSVALLERLGVWPRLAGAVAPLKTLRIVDGTKRLIRAPEVAFHCQEIGLDAFGYNVPNAALVEALEAGLSAHGIRRVEAFAEGLESGTDDVAVLLSGGERLVARLVVAADGRRSRIREACGIGVSEWRYDQSAMVVNLGHQFPHDDTSTEFHTEYGPFTLVPLPGRRSSLVWVDRPAAAARHAELSDEALAAVLEKRSAGLLGAITIEGRRQVFPLAGMTARHFSAPRVAFIGEAAHVFPPIGAQGLNLGYRDVAALGEILATRHADPGTPGHLARYGRARRGDVLGRTAAVDALNRTLLTGFLPVQGVRGLGLFLLDRVPTLRRAAMRQGLAQA